VIYEAVPPGAPIQQGDIFRNIPRVEISLAKMSVLVRRDEDTDVQEIAWHAALGNRFAVDQSDGCIRAVLPIFPAHGIVITQNCDALRAEAISLCEIAPFKEVFGGAMEPGSRNWVKTLTRQGTEGLRWFYLPEDSSFGFPEKMGADFRTIMAIPRTDLEVLRSMRVGRLNNLAYEHFREKLAEFFRRYPVNAWYPLNKQELEQYVKDNGPVEPVYDWQK
jgi:hypothetical protein